MLLQKTKKKYTNQIINNGACAFEDVCGSKKNGAALIIFLHFFGVLMIALMLFSHDDVLIIVGSFMWLLIITMHLVFDGCFLVKIERKLLENKEWVHIWCILFNIIAFFGKKINKSEKSKIYSFVGIVISLLILNKLRKIKRFH